MYLNPLQFKQPLRLNIGAGDVSDHPDFTTVDLFTEADIKATMWSIPLPNESVEHIVSTNALEHISKHKIIPTLKEWHRLLQVGGKLSLMIPDLEWAVNYWLQYKDTEWATGWPLDIIYGHQAHDGEYHKTGFTPHIIFQYMHQAVPNGWKINSIEYIWGEEKNTKLDEERTLVEAVQRGITVDADKLRLGVV